ncbi:SIR2 family protein [Marinobacter segnicrescens]|uniref:SIR2 family protein n=1 Tax=Marinobacter segnicrescens TaxID=430453 RepID=UPI003A8DE749
MSGEKHILKVRDDASPIKFEGDPSAGKFQCENYSETSWLNSGEFGYKELRSRIEPWLTSLFQAEHLSLLAGSGLTHAIHFIAAGKPAAGMSSVDFVFSDKEIKKAAKESAERSGRDQANIEDQLRVANELLRGLEILGKQTDAEGLSTELKAIIENFGESILQSERTIAEAGESERQKAWNTLITFLMSFASRTGVRDRLNIFTTNYDRLIEAGAEVAGLHLLDRFLGNLMPVFRSSRLDLDMHYNPPGIRGEPRYLEGVARFTKLHGSVDWIQAEQDIRRIGLPFGAEHIKPYLDAPGLRGVDANKLMIYPNSAKDRETADYPYVELFRDFAAAICRPNSTLVTYGYSFGDEHINRVIRDMLSIPSTHLVIISRDDTLGRITKTYDDLGRSSQISLMVGPGLADIQNLTKYFLPKAAIDKTTSRMSELLRQRFNSEQKTSERDEEGGDSGGEQP